MYIQLTQCETKCHNCFIVQQSATQIAKRNFNQYVIPYLYSDNNKGPFSHSKQWTFQYGLKSIVWWRLDAWYSSLCQDGSWMKKFFIPRYDWWVIWASLDRKPTWERHSNNTKLVTRNLIMLTVKTLGQSSGSLYFFDKNFKENQNKTLTKQQCLHSFSL